MAKLLDQMKSRRAAAEARRRIQRQLFVIVVFILCAQNLKNLKAVEHQWQDPLTRTSTYISSTLGSLKVFPETRFTPHVQGILSIVEKHISLPKALPASRSDPYPFDPIRFCPTGFRLVLDQPYSVPSRLECHQGSSMCSFFRDLFFPKNASRTRILPYNVTWGQSTADMIKPGTMAMGNCLGSSAPNSQFVMNNFQDVKEHVLLKYETDTPVNGYVHAHTLEWEQRNTQPVFRGHPRMKDAKHYRNTKGCPKDASGLGYRVHAAIFSLDHPDLLDARVYYDKARHPCVDQNVTGRVEQVFRLGAFKDQPEVAIPSNEYYTRYQTAVVLGGIGAAFRTARHLSAGQAVVLQQFTYEEWFVPYMKPYHHYIPLQQDLSDLQQVMEWVRDHPTEVKQIAENGKQFYWEYMSFVQNEEHWYELLWRLSLLIHEKGLERYKTGSGRSIWPAPIVPLTFERPESGGWATVDVKAEFDKEDGKE